MSNTFTSLVRIGTEPEVKFIPSGKAVLSFSAASTVGYGDKKQTIWLRVTSWQNPEKMATMLAKGNQIVVSGELSQREYTKDGQTKTSLELNANNIELISGQNQSAQQPTRLPQPTPQQRAASGHSQQKSNGYAPQHHEEIDEIPF